MGDAGIPKYLRGLCYPEEHLINSKSPHCLDEVEVGCELCVWGGMISLLNAKLDKTLRIYLDVLEKYICFLL